MRSLEEWRGKDGDAVPPPRVRVRVFDRCEGKCHACKRKIRPGDKWTLEHIVALINGGENRENNLGLTCAWCLPGKNAEDVAEKSKVYETRAKHLGIKAKKRPFPGGRGDKFKKRMNGTVERRP